MTSDHSVTEPFGGTAGKTDKDESKRLARITSAIRNAADEGSTDTDGSPDVTLDLLGHVRKPVVEDAENVEEIVFSDDADEVESGYRETTPVAATEEGIAEETDDLANYMQSFLQRMKVGGEVVEEAIEAAAVATPPKPKAEAEPEPEEPEHSAYAGRKAAPERFSDLQAMREVANASVKDSLSRHDHQVVVQTQIALTIAICCSLLSSVMAWLATAVMDYAFIASLVCFGVAGVSAWRYSSGMQKLKPGGSRMSDAAS